jgi:hypothetical protein
MRGYRTKAGLGVAATLAGACALLSPANTLAQAVPESPWRVASAQMRDLCPDRPGKGTPSCILDAGHLELEVGVADAIHDDADGVKSDTLALGRFELRLGLTSMMETEVSWTPFVTTRTRLAGAAASRDTGVGDVTLSIRRSLLNPGGDGVSVALQPYVSAPTAMHGFGAGGWAGGLIAPISLPLTSGLSLALSPEIDVVRDAAGGGTHLAWTGVAGLSHDLGPVTAGVELWASRDDDPAGATTQATVDLTAAWAPKALPNCQFDLGVNAGLDHDAPDLEIYVGLARRF